MLAKDQGGCPLCECERTVVRPVNVPYEKEENDDDVGGGGGGGIICPAFKCDLHCELGLLMDENDCTLCQCKPQATCPPVSCRKKCPYGYKLNRRGCPVNIIIQ